MEYSRARSAFGDNLFAVSDMGGAMRTIGDDFNIRLWVIAGTEIAVLAMVGSALLSAIT
jgi:hypothetical protein